MTVNHPNNKPASSYESEYMDALRTLFNESSQIEAIRYFLNTTYTVISFIVDSSFGQ